MNHNSNSKKIFESNVIASKAKQSVNQTKDYFVIKLLVMTVI